jgi:sulfonate transport system substrate-binding protein
MNKILHIIVLALLGSALFGGSTALAAEKVIRIGFPGGTTSRPVSGGGWGYVQAKNLFDEEFRKDGWTIEYNYIKSAGPGVNEGLANNSLDFGFHGDLPVLAARSGGLKIKALAAVRGGTSHLLVPSNSSIRTIRDLKGKRVGVNMGTWTHALLIKVLKDNGLTMKDLNVINTSGTAFETALTTGDIDAGFGSLPLIRSGRAREIWSTVGKHVRYQNTNTLVVREEFLKKHPDIVKRLVKVYVKGLYQASLNKNETLKFNTRTGSALADNIEENAGQSIKYLTSPKLDGQVTQQYKDSLALFKENGLIRKTFDPEKDLYERHYLDEVLKELKLENHWPDYDINGNPIKK